MNQTEEQMEKYIRQVHRHLRLSRDMKERVESDLRTDIQLRLETGKDMEEIIRDVYKRQVCNFMISLNFLDDLFRGKEL